MPLSTIFANLTSAAGAQLDQVLAQLGAITPIPCTVSGTNVLVLTPAANTPTIPAYANYLQVTGITAVSNTGAVTVNVASLGVVNVYKDTLSGPAALVGGELVANCAFVLFYDSTLNGNTGGFHLTAGPFISGSYLLLSGGTVTGTANIAHVIATTDLKVPSTGIAITRILSATASLAFGNIAQNNAATFNIAVAGAQLGDAAFITMPAGLAASGGFTIVSCVSSANTVNITITATNPSGVALGTLVWRATVIGFT